LFRYTDRLNDFESSTYIIYKQPTGGGAGENHILTRVLLWAISWADRPDVWVWWNPDVLQRLTQRHAGRQTLQDRRRESIRDCLCIYKARWS